MIDHRTKLQCKRLNENRERPTDCSTPLTAGKTGLDSGIQTPGMHSLPQSRTFAIAASYDFRRHKAVSGVLIDTPTAQALSDCALSKSICRSDIVLKVPRLAICFATAHLLTAPMVGSHPTTSFPRKAAVGTMIVADGLVKRFATKGGWIEAVREVSFQVGEGEVYGLLGPNGAGKTTTLRMVMGLLEPDQGTVSIDGKSSQENSVHLRSQIGMISTNDGVYPWLSAKEMLLYFGDLYGIDPPLAHSRLFELSAMLGITRILDQRCNTLSTGQRQRVILARGLMHDPPVILLDEPTRGLDIVGSRTIFDFIGHLKQLGKSVLLSTHRLDEAERLCDRFGLLHEGQMQMEGSLTELKERTGRSNLTDIFLDLLRRPGNFIQAEQR